MKRYRFSSKMWTVSKTRIRQLIRQRASSRKHKNNESTVENVRQIDNYSNCVHANILNENMICECFDDHNENSSCIEDNSNVFDHGDNNNFLGNKIIEDLENENNYDDNNENRSFFGDNFDVFNNDGNDDFIENETIEDFDIENYNQGLIESLKKVFIEHGITTRAISDILNVLREFDIKVPKTKFALFKTQHSNSKNTEIKPMDDGKFAYIGIENNLLQCNNSILKNSDKGGRT